jgi:hypothetical protein
MVYRAKHDASIAGIKVGQVGLWAASTGHTRWYACLDPQVLNTKCGRQCDGYTMHAATRYITSLGTTVRVGTGRLRGVCSKWQHERLGLVSVFHISSTRLKL